MVRRHHFFLGNYIAHAATITTLPGETWVDVTLATVLALLFPVSGVVRGVRAIQSLAIFGRNDLEKAARARALAVIVEKDVRGDVPSSTKIHGAYYPHDDYTLKFIPKYTKSKATADSVQISCNYNVVKILASIGQTIFEAVTLYRARGDQIDRYGYASFGLTVTPYIFMSVVNLLGNLVCPTYSTIFIVRSNSLRYPYNVDGTVGDIKDMGPAGRRISLYASTVINWVIAAVCAAAPIAIIGGMSSFQSGSSTLPQRVWTMTWLVLGSSLVIIVDTSKHILDARRRYLILQKKYEEELKKLVSAFEKITGKFRTAKEKFEAEARPNNDLIQQITTGALLPVNMDTWELQKKEILGPAKELADELGKMPRGRLYKLGLDEFKRRNMIRDLETLGWEIVTMKEVHRIREVWSIMQENFLPSSRGDTEPMELESTRKSMSERKRDLADVHPFQHRENDFYIWLGLLVVCGAPAIGGFVVVGQMIIDYGVCIRIA
ncbi:hypothetical protein COCMIDRAFT_4900 [Bipolaris oryzae ATCC 44560]|uniref:Uncharacterized protein n=1 Tax=Bipolaris oryzae ATCC 44560 TaxID=930090 RepID=W6Z852_COCMI|nr:uncharacterized protein COCMIDRAFT_4900 [Bipolaris oryzae ATCC 44560]EUC45958.1 hypothetical protein COCMIDRAFT_4900 [Bipolaris oryzae ATCC 44560]